MSSIEREIPHLDGVEHRIVSAGGLRMHVAEAGDPDAPPLLLVHGWPQNWFAWHELIGPLAETRRVIAPDLRGFGWTDAPPGGYDPEVFAGDLAALLDALNVDGPVDYMGHDWGGWTGFILALRQPERVRRLLALGIIHPFVRPNARAVLGGWRFWYQWLLGAPGIGTAALRMTIHRNPVLLYLGANQDVWGPEELRVYAEQFEEPERAAATRLLYRHAAFRLQLQLREYRQLRMETPTLMLFPAEDAVQKRINLGGYEDNAPNLVIEVVPKASHFVVDERPALVLDRARGFFKG